MQSLSRKFLVSIGIMSLMVTVLGSIAGFVVFQHNLADRQIRYLDDYVRERSSNIDRRFTNLESMHQSAVRELQARASHLRPADVDRLMNLYYPLQADGTRRSRPMDFDGETKDDGERVYGMGAFLPHPEDLTAREKATLVAAYTIVSDFGQAERASYDNFYFFTPKTRLVMFGPDRPDRLMFYRHDAPANLDVSKEDMARITLPAADPQRITRCTALQRLIQNAHGERLATGCITPAYIDGQFMGSFGSSIQLTGFFLSAVKNALPGSTSLIVTADGTLIAYPEFSQRKSASPDLLDRYERDLGLRAMMKSVRSSARDSGVVTSPDGRNIVAYGRLYGPSWYLLLSYPKAAIAWSAAKSASWILLLGLIASVVQTLLVVWMARRTLVKPLERLSASCAPQAAGPGDIAEIEQRADEIGVLARALRTRSKSRSTTNTCDGGRSRTSRVAKKRARPLRPRRRPCPRPAHRARTGRRTVVLARGSGPGTHGGAGARQRRKIALPGQYEPRVAHAPQWRHRHLGLPGGQAEDQGEPGARPVDRVVGAAP